jgi:hypothetical protein
VTRSRLHAPNIGAGLLSRARRRSRGFESIVVWGASLVLLLAAGMIALVAWQPPVLVTMDSGFHGDLPTTAAAPLCVALALAVMVLAVMVALRPTAFSAACLVGLGAALVLTALAYKTPLASLLGPLEVCHGHFDQYCARLTIGHGETFAGSVIVLVVAVIAVAGMTFERSRRDTRD